MGGKKTTPKQNYEETTSFVNGSLITDQWFDSSRQSHTLTAQNMSSRGSAGAEAELCIQIYTKIIIILRTKHTYNEAKQTNQTI